MRSVRGIALVAGLCLAACSSSLTPLSLQTQALRTLGDVAAAVDAANQAAAPNMAVDTDGDSIPDSVELELGTNPNDRDTDHDGLPDNFELFGNSYDPNAPLPDMDHDGIIAPLDPDDNGDGINDGLSVDSDGDGIPNLLEVNGFSYDYLTGQFVEWNGDPTQPHYFTDPLQPSTDQDAYTDGMEVSKLRLDPTVRAPGDDPLVPAYPDIVCDLASYTVTLNEDIQVTQSESLEKGKSWTRQTEQSNSHSVQTSWQVGGEYDFSVDGGAKVSANFGQTYDNTNTTSTSVATGQSVTSNEGWSEARSSNPTSAAYLKLFLKVHNRGTAPISNLVPTLSLKIGGLSVATFQPGGPDVSILVPGAVYPSDPNSYWVVDSKNTGGGVVPLSLTMGELRALERGAPVSISVTQVNGDTMRLTPDGTWVSIGDTNEYVGRCDAVCANLRIELANGDQVHQLVYAGQGPSAPTMTLGQALQKIGVAPDGTLTYLDDHGTMKFASLGGYNFAIDPPTLRRNGWTLAGDGAPATTAPPGFVLDDMRLYPDSNIFIRAPRPPSAPPTPSIEFAYLDPNDGSIEVSASDYEGITQVVVRNEDGSETQTLAEDVPGAGFYSGNARGDNGFDPGSVLTVEVTNLAGFTATQPLGTLYIQPGPQPPIINSVELNLDENYVYANVESGNPDAANSQIQWVRAYYTPSTLGYSEMPQVIDFFRDPNGYEASLKAGFQAGDSVEVVAYVAPGVYTSHVVTADETTQVQIRFQGSSTLYAENADTIVPDRYKWTSTSLNLDASTISGVRTQSVVKSVFPPDPPGSPKDLTLEFDESFTATNAFIHWNANYMKVDGGNLATYRSLTRAQIEQDAPGITNQDPIQASATLAKNVQLQVGQVYEILTTPEGLPGKLYVDSISQHLVGIKRYVTVVVRYVIFEKSP